MNQKPPEHLHNIIVGNYCTSVINYNSRKFSKLYLEYTFVQTSCFIYLAFIVMTTKMSLENWKKKIGIQGKLFQYVMNIQKTYYKKISIKRKLRFIRFIWIYNIVNNNNNTNVNNNKSLIIIRKALAVK